MRFLLAVLFVAAASMPGQGATLVEWLALCGAKGAALERLSCYDELARAVAGGVVEPLSSTGIGKWMVDQELDPIDDTMDLFAMLPSEDWVMDRSGALIGIICRGGGDGLDVQFVLQGVRVAYPTGKYADDLYSMVTWRFDKEKAVSGSWVVSKDREMLYPSFSGPYSTAEYKKEQIQWAKDILVHSQLFVRIKDSDSRQGKGDFLFDLRGAEKAVSPVLDACGW